MTSIMRREFSGGEGAMLLLHGLGSSGKDLLPLAEALDKGKPRVALFANAPLRPVAMKGGESIPAWFDLDRLEGGRMQVREDQFRESVRFVLEIMDDLLQEGFAPEEVCLLGFSQGAGVAIAAGVEANHPLLGVAALSGYFPAGLMPRKAAPLFVFMAHGTEDDVVSIDYARRTKEALEKRQAQVEWREYPMGHSACLEEVRDLEAWILRRRGALI